MATAQFGTVYIGESCEVTVSYEQLKVSTNTLDFRVSLVGEEETYTWTPSASEIVQSTKGDFAAVYVWTPPASLARYIPNSPSAECVFTVYETRYTSVGQAYPTTATSTTTTMYVPQSLAPTVEMTLTPESDSAKINEWGIFVRGMTRVQYAINATPQYGASIASYSFSMGGHTTQEASGTTPILITAGAPTAVVTDSRGKTTKRQEAVDIYDYSAPTLRDTVEYRCDADGTPNESGTYLRVQCSAVCSSLGGRNTVSVRARYRKAGEDYGDYTVLTGGVETQIATGLDTTAVYEVELSAIDAVGSVEAVSFIGDNGRIAMHLRDGGDGAAFGKKCTAAGFACAWDAAFDGNVAVAGALTVGGKSIVDIVYPIGSIYLSVSGTSPATLFGGTWTQIKDKFLLSAGSTYSLGSTGGAATVTLTANQMPKHTHYVSGDTGATALPHIHDLTTYSSVVQGGTNGDCLEDWGGYNASYGSRNLTTDGVKGSNLNHAHSFSTTSNSSGGDGAHDNMPPYLAVNVWQRTA